MQLYFMGFFTSLLHETLETVLERRERCLMMQSISLQLHFHEEDGSHQHDIRVVMRKPLDIMAGLIRL